MVSPWEIYYEDEHIIAEETEMAECVVTNKCSHPIFLRFDINSNLKDIWIAENSSGYLMDKILIDFLRKKQVTVINA